MKVKEILAEILETGVDLIEVPFKVSRYSLLKPKDIKYGGRAYRSLKHLESEEMVVVKELEDVTQIIITKKGKTRALKYSLDEMELKRPKRWDQKWRIIIFDIPDAHKNGRNVLQAKLTSLGFVMLQKSVYVHPYECFDEIDFIRRIYNIKPFVKYILAEDVEDAKKLLFVFHRKGFRGLNEHK